MEEEIYNSLEDYNKNKKLKNKDESTEELYISKYENMMKPNNAIASILKVFGWITIILGFIFGLVLGVNELDEFDFLITLGYWAIFDFSALSMFAISEIIKLLHDIRYKLWLK